MSDTCATCSGEGWVCEAHPDRPWNRAGCMCSPGVTCNCNDRGLNLPSFDEPMTMSRQYAERRRRRLS